MQTARNLISSSIWLYPCGVAWLVGATACGMVPQEPSSAEFEDARALEEDSIAMDEEQPWDRARGAEGQEKGVLMIQGDEPMIGSAAPPAPPPKPDAAGAPSTAAQAVATRDDTLRDWFPETMLWEPLIVTDDNGQATVPMTVPDQLTTWRILGLAHTRTGRQAGGVHSVRSTLPAYVEPRVPEVLRVGDELTLPSRVVNTTRKPLTVALSTTVTGALDVQGAVDSTPFEVASLETQRRTIGLAAATPGVAMIDLSLSMEDALIDQVRQQLQVLPTGRPTVSMSGGSLTPGQRFSIGPETGVAVRLYSGPMSVFEAELKRVSATASVSSAAYGYYLSRRAAELAELTSAEVSAEETRRLRILSMQGLRVPSSTVTRLGAIRWALGSQDETAIRAYAEDELRRLMRADGTWSTQTTAPLDQVLFETMFVARAFADSPPDWFRYSIQGAMERHASSVSDPVVAAAMLATGHVPEASRNVLANLVSSAFTRGETGWNFERSSSSAAGPDRVQLAWCVLAQPEAPWVGWAQTQLLLASERAEWSGTDQDIVILEALAETLKPLPESVAVTLFIGDQRVDQVSIDPSQPMAPRVLRGHGQSETEARLVMEPQVTGLGWVLTETQYVPWSEQARVDGVEVEVEQPTWSVGAQDELTVRIKGPPRRSVKVQLGLPPSTMLRIEKIPIGGTLASLLGGVDVADPYPRLQSVQQRGDRLVIQTEPLSDGEMIELRLPMRPGLAGRFTGAPTEISLNGARQEAMRPEVWTIR